MLRVYLLAGGYAIGAIFLWAVISYATLEPNPMEWNHGLRVMHALFPLMGAAIGFSLGELLEDE